MRHSVNLACVVLISALAGGVAGAAPVLSLDGSAAAPGGTATLSLMLSGGTEPYAGVNARILLPEGMSFQDASPGALLSGGAFGLDSHASPAGNSEEVTILAYSGADTFETEGVLAVLSVMVDSELASGEYPVVFDGASKAVVNPEHALSNEDGTVAVVHSVEAGTIEVSDVVDPDLDRDGLPDAWELENLGTTSEGANDDHDGDGLTNLEEFEGGTNPALFVGNVNGDTTVDLADALLIVRLHWGAIGQADLGNYEAGDVNGDGSVNLSDALLVVRRHWGDLGHLGK